MAHELDIVVFRFTIRYRGFLVANIFGCIIPSVREGRNISENNLSSFVLNENFS
jgi:hypothetical protein